MEPKRTLTHPVVVIGGGPAGLTAAHELIKLKRRPFILEKRDKVGGLARTEGYQGFYFDMGGRASQACSTRPLRVFRRCGPTPTATYLYPAIHQ